MSWKVILKNDAFEDRFNEAEVNLKTANRELQSVLQSRGKTSSAMKKYKQAEREYKKLLRELKVQEKEKRKIQRDEKRALQPLKDEAKKVRIEFNRKKDEVVQDFLKYVDGFGVEDNQPLRSLKDLGLTTEKGRVFRKVYERAAKNADIFGHSNKITYENYKDFEGDSKIDRFRNALEESKEFYKDEIRGLYLARIRGR
mgnify:CR=1 FL=1